MEESYDQQAQYEHEAHQRKITLLLPELCRFTGLMEKSDTQISLDNANERLLKTDPVYRSPLASADMKASIAQRRAIGMTLEQFASEYNRIYTAATAAPLARVDPNERALAIRAAYEHAITVSRHTPATVEAFRTNFCLTHQTTTELLAAEKEYNTNLQTLAKLVHLRFNPQDIRQLLYARKELSTDAHTPRAGAPSVKQLAEFHDRYCSGPIDGDTIVELIAETVAVLGARYLTETAYDALNFLFKHALDEIPLEDTLDALLNSTRRCAGQEPDTEFSDSPLAITRKHSDDDRVPSWCNKKAFGYGARRR